MSATRFLAFLLLALVAFLGFTAVLTCCNPQEARRADHAERMQARAEQRADSLQRQLSYAVAWAAADSLHRRGLEAAHNAHLDEKTVRATSARSWSIDSLSEFLANPYGLHAPRAGR